MVVFNKILNTDVKSVLLVDDDEDDITIFQLALQSIDQQIQLQFSQSGYEALELLKKMNTNFPSVIFLDLNMPRLNGLECLSKIKIHDVWQNIPVVILSTSINENDKRKAFELGAIGFVSKPHSFAELCSILTSIVKREPFTKKYTGNF
jgi:CheY-like chemotaxis protein